MGLEGAYHLSFCGTGQACCCCWRQLQQSKFTLRHSWPRRTLGGHWRQRRRRRRTRRRLPWCRRLGAGCAGWSPWWWTWPARWSPPGPPSQAPPCSPARRRTMRRGQSWSKGCKWSGCRTKALLQRPSPLWDSCTPLPMIQCNVWKEVGLNLNLLTITRHGQRVYKQIYCKFKFTCCCCHIAVLVAAVSHFETTRKAQISWRIKIFLPEDK